MKESIEYLINLTKETKKILVDPNITTSKFLAKLNKGALSLHKKFDYEESYEHSLELKKVLNKISSIIYKPHINVETSEIITRSELSGSLTRDSFIETLKDTKLWKRKRNEETLVPEYVHSLEYIDTIVTYENRFISYLITLIEGEAKSLLNVFNVDFMSLEKIYESNGLTYGSYSLLNSLYNKDNSKLSLLDPFKDNEGETNIKLLDNLNYIIKKIKILKNTTFYKLNMKEKKLIEVIPTNILIHDDLYSYCYKYYKKEFLVKGVNDNTLDTYYHNYIVLLILEYLSKNKETKVQLNKVKFFEDEDNKLSLSFSDFIINLNDEIEYQIIDNSKDNSILIKTRILVAKDELNEVPSSTTYLKCLYQYNESLISNLELYKTSVLNNSKDINNFIYVTNNNETSNYKNILNLNEYKENYLELMNNFINSLTMLFKLHNSIYLTKCPICGSSFVTLNEHNHQCNECNSLYSVINIKRKKAIWVKSFRR